jgi:hypothetical protein
MSPTLSEAASSSRLAWAIMAAAPEVVAGFVRAMRIAALRSAASARFH